MKWISHESSDSIQSHECQSKAADALSAMQCTRKGDMGSTNTKSHYYHANGFDNVQ